MIILLSRSNHYKSKLIRLATKSQFSHAAIYDPELNLILEAQGGVGVVLTRPQDYAQRYSYTLAAYIPGDINKAYSKLGAPFDEWGVWAINFKVGWQVPEKWFCSELIAYASDFIKDEYAHWVTPEFLSWFEFEWPEEEKQHVPVWVELKN